MTAAEMDYATHLRERAARAGIPAVDLSTPSDRYLDRDAMSHHYLDWRGEGSPVLLLHGGGLNAHTWDLCCLALRERYRCLAPDLRGHGDTSWSQEGDYALSSYAADIIHFIDALRLERLALVGMSLGGLVALHVAIALRTRITSLSLVDIVPVKPQGVGVRAMQEFRAVETFADLDTAVAHAVAFNPRRSPDGLRFSLSRNLRKLDTGELTWKHDRRRFAGRGINMDPDRMLSLWTSSREITCPVLLARGAESTAVRADDAVRFVNSLPNARLVSIPDAGHTVQGDNPKGLLKELVPFLADNEAAALP